MFLSKEWTNSPNVSPDRIMKVSCLQLSKMPRSRCISRPRPSRFCQHMSPARRANLESNSVGILNVSDSSEVKDDFLLFCLTVHKMSSRIFHTFVRDQLILVASFPFSHMHRRNIPAEKLFLSLPRVTATKGISISTNNMDPKKARLEMVPSLCQCVFILSWNK